MEKTNVRVSKILKWFTLLALVLAVSFPVMEQQVQAATSGTTYCVIVSRGYLALRNAKAYDSSNEIGELYSGDLVKVQDFSDSTYWYVYSRKHDAYGYVNKNYLVSSRGSAWTVRVDQGYLALRDDTAYDASNEIGELYTGDTVRVYEADESGYWYVYAPSLGAYGWVNSDYIYPNGTSDSSDIKTVSVSSGYLALRTEKEYDYSNEIGELYTGDVIQTLDTRDSQYWYVYSPKLGRSGYVNKDYLLDASPKGTRTVSVSSGYLALRCAKAYDADNEIGELYTGEVVKVLDSSDSSYWYVYSESLGKCGFVNKDYLVDTSASATAKEASDSARVEMVVNVDSGYLALRNEKCYDANNEIGQLDDGEIVEVLSMADTEYWYVYAPSLDRYGYVNCNYLY